MLYQILFLYYCFAFNLRIFSRYSLSGVSVGFFMGGNNYLGSLLGPCKIWKTNKTSTFLYAYHLLFNSDTKFFFRIRRLAIESAQGS
jgi:hypothetical protein